VLALLPAATNDILEAMDTEKLSLEIQNMKGAARPAGAASPPSIAETTLTDEEGKSTISDSGVHVSQTSVPSPAVAAGDGVQDGGAAAAAAQRARKTKRQLWDDLTISCKSLCQPPRRCLTINV
jgi:peroxin-3